MPKLSFRPTREKRPFSFFGAPLKALFACSATVLSCLSRVFRHRL